MRSVMLLGLALSLSASAEEPDLDNGAFLHGDHCIECHMMDDHEALYSRENRLPSRFRINGQVSACVQALDLGWFPEEESDVAAYLNDTYYHYDE